MNDHIIAEIENEIMQCCAGLADAKSYNRFHMQRIRDLIDGKDTLMNHEENVMLNSACWSLELRLEWIVRSFAELQGVLKIPIKNFMLRCDFFTQEIKELEDAVKWLKIVEAAK